MERREHRSHATHAEHRVLPESGRKSTWRAIDAAPTRRHIRIAAGCVILVIVMALACAAGAALSLRLDQSRGAATARAANESAVVGEVVSIKRAANRAKPATHAIVGYTVGGVARTASIEIGPLSGGLRTGQSIDLIVDAQEPADVRAVEAAGPSGFSGRSAALIVLAAMLAGAAAWFGVLLVRRRRVLTRNPWVVVPARIVDMPVGYPGGRCRYLLLDDPTTEHVTVEAAGVRPLVDELTPAAWVAGDGEHFLVAPPGGAPVLAVDRVRTRGWFG